MDARCRRTRHAFTLIELLIAMGIIAVLVSLSIPAIVHVRERARRVECGNNLRQIAMAFQAHHDMHKFFPTGGWNWADPPTFSSNGTPLIGAAQKAGWGYQVLPFIGGEEIWTGGSGTNNQERVLIAIKTPLSIFFCPSRRTPMVYAYCPPRSTSDPFVENIYDLNRWSRPPIFTAQSDYVVSNYNPDQNGIVRRKFPNKIGSVTDGLSNTLLAGEKRMNLRSLGMLDVNNDQGYADGWDGDTVGRTDVQPGQDVNVAAVQGVFLIRPPFGSSHVASFNAAFADATVRRISYSIRLSVFVSLGDINDGLPSGGLSTQDDIK